MDKTDLSIVVDTINNLVAKQKDISRQVDSLVEYTLMAITCQKESQDVLLDYNFRIAQLEKAQTQKGENDEQE